MCLYYRSMLSRFILIVTVLLLSGVASAQQIEGVPPSAPATSSGVYTVSWELYYLQESSDGVNWRTVSNFASQPSIMEFSKPSGTYYYRTFYFVGYPVYITIVSPPIEVRVTP